ATSGSFGMGFWSAAASVSVAYVSSTRADSNAELNTQTDLTGEVELHFQSDYFPIQRFSDADGIDKIRANTPVPAANTPMTPPIPWGDTSPPRPVEPMGPPRQPDKTQVATASPLPQPPPLPDAKKDAAKKDELKKEEPKKPPEAEKKPADAKPPPEKPPV